MEAPNPKIETEETKTEEQAKDVNADITEALEKLGITDGQQLENMSTASQQTGRLAQMVGDLRSELAETKAALKQVPQTPEQTLYDDLDDRPLTRRELKGFWQEVTEANTKAQQQAWGEWSSIQGDPHYAAFKERFESELQKPENQHKLNTGQTSLSTVYNNVVINGLKGLLSSMKTEIDKVKGSEKPPHIESQTSTDALSMQEKTDKQEQLEKIIKSRKGNDDDISKMLNALLPEGEITKMRMS